MSSKIIVIEGNIGSGKTTLAKKLSSAMGSRLILEQFADNPFLPKFYETPERYAFPLELYFMAERFQQLKENLDNPDLFQPLVISDYMFTKSLIFAKVTLMDDEFNLYKRIFDIINPNLPKPDLLIYLYANTDKLISNIRKRGREYEQNIQPEYLVKLQRTYLDFFNQSEQFPVLIVDINDTDLIHNEDNFKKLTTLVDGHFEPGVQIVEL
jgi:deoxyadenosine/deoxycytidine kinase